MAAGHQGGIIAKIQESGLRVVALKSLRLSKTQAEGFYAVHSARPFFGSLAIAISGVALMLYVMTNGIGGGIA